MSLIINPHRVTFNPHDLGSDLQIWLDASDEDTITESSGSVSQWDDKSGNGRHATQGTGANQPITGSVAQNTLNTIDFNGSSHFFNVDLDWTSGVSHTAFVLCKTDTNPNSNLYGAANGSAGAASIHVGYHSGADQFRMNYWGNDWYGAYPAAHNALGWNLLVFKWTYNSRKDIYVNSDTGIGTAQAGSPIAPSGGGRISNVTGLGYYNGAIGEMIFTNTAMADALRQTVRDYLLAKWGVS